MLNNLLKVLREEFKAWENVNFFLDESREEITVMCKLSDCSANIQIYEGLIYCEVFDSGSNDVLFVKIKDTELHKLREFARKAIEIFKTEYEEYFA